MLGFSLLLAMFNYKLKKGPCAFEESVWKQDAVSLLCLSPGNDYHCISDENKRLVELCIQHIWVNPSKYKNILPTLNTQYIFIYYYYAWYLPKGDQTKIYLRVHFCVFCRWFLNRDINRNETETWNIVPLLHLICVLMSINTNAIEHRYAFVVSTIKFTVLMFYVVLANL